MRRLWPHLVPWLLVVAIGAPLVVYALDRLDAIRGAEPVVWKHPRAFVLAAGGGFVGWILFHLRRHRAATFAFTRVGALDRSARGVAAHLTGLPGALRVLALVAISAALARPQTFRTETRVVDSVDIMIVFDLSKSMEESDMSPRRDRLDAAQFVVRQFLAKREGDRVGLAIFGQGAMLQCPLTLDLKVLDWIVADLQIGDVPESGTAIGDGLGMALGQLQKSDAKSKVVVLLSDGDNNVVTAFTPSESAAMARKMGVKVFTVLVGAEGGIPGWGGSVDPDTMRDIAHTTGGRFFRATDSAELNQSFDEVRKTLDKTRRVITQRVPDKELFPVLVGIAALLLLAELVLASTRFRRFP